MKVIIAVFVSIATFFIADGFAQAPKLPSLPQPNAGKQVIPNRDVRIGDLVFKVPDTYEFQQEQGSILGQTFFVKLQGMTNPDIYLSHFAHTGTLEDAANYYFDTQFANRFTLMHSETIPGTPRKILLKLQGVETQYDVFIMDVNRRGAYLVGIVPLPNGVESVYSATAQTIISSGTY